MGAFKLLKSRNTLFIQVRDRAAFHVMDSNPSSTPSPMSWDLSVLTCRMGWGRQGRGYKVLRAFQGAPRAHPLVLPAPDQ